MSEQQKMDQERAAFEAWRLEKFCAGVERLKKCSNAPDVYYYSAEQEAWKVWKARAALSAPQHPDDEAVDRFATAMKVKLAAARAKGRGGWDDPNVCSVEFLAQLLVKHLGKGNAGTFEDVANFAMMLHQRGADPMVLAEAAEAPIKKARGEALELGVRALESKSEHTEPAPAQGEPPQSGITIEKDVFGTVHIKLGDFDYIQIQYQYPYTDNASQNALAKRIAELLTRPAQTEQQPVEWQHKKPTVNDSGEIVGYSTWTNGKGLDWWPHRPLYAAPVAQTEQQPLIYINPMVVDELEGKRKASPGGLTWSRKALAHWTFPLYTAPIAQTAPQPQHSALVEALKAMLETYGPPAAVADKCTYPADHPITKARAALSAQGGQQ